VRAAGFALAQQPRGVVAIFKCVECGARSRRTERGAAAVLVPATAGNAEARYPDTTDGTDPASGAEFSAWLGLGFSAMVWALLGAMAAGGPGTFVLGLVFGGWFVILLGLIGTLLLSFVASTGASEVLADARATEKARTKARRAQAVAGITACGWLVVPVLSASVAFG